MKLILICCFFLAVKALPTIKWKKLKISKTTKAAVFNSHDLTDGPHIIGGTEAERGAFPFQAAVFIDVYWFCGGSLISEDVVLTAAHCTYDFSNFEVYLGSHDIRAGSEEGRQILMTIDKVVHLNFDPVLYKYDIALLKLSAPVTLTDLVQPVRLPSRSQIGQTFEGQRTNVSGWGIVRDGGSQSSVLLFTEVEVIDNVECQSHYLLEVVEDHMLCVSTSEGTHGPCNGDSGGPLVLLEKDGQYTEVGVVSWGADAGCEAGYPEVFTRLTFFLDWIQDNGGPLVRP